MRILTAAICLLSVCVLAAGCKDDKPQTEQTTNSQEKSAEEGKEAEEGTEAEAVPVELDAKTRAMNALARGDELAVLPCLRREFRKGERMPRHFAFHFYKDGQLVKKRISYGNAPQEPKVLETYKYDDNGRLAEITIDGDDFKSADGEQDGFIQYEYDDAGRVAKVTRKPNSDAEPSPNTYEYERGLLTKIKSSGYPMDPPTDANVDKEYRFRYDDNGRLIEKLRFDQNRTEKPARSWRFEYDADGNLTQESYDLGADGSPERVSTFEYDENGHLVRKKVGQQEAGSVNEEYKYTYEKGCLAETAPGWIE